jgi:hypothetical protein
MFEEDFDPNDECHKTLHSYVSKVAPRTEELTSFNEILETNPSIAEDFSGSLSLNSDPQAISQNIETSPEEKLDSWLDDMEIKPQITEKKPTRLSSTSSSGESGQNPLVTKFEDVSDSESCSEEKYDGIVSSLLLSHNIGLFRISRKKKMIFRLTESIMITTKRYNMP